MPTNDQRDDIMLAQIMHLDRIASPLPSDDAPTMHDVYVWLDTMYIITNSSTDADIADALRAGMSVYDIAHTMTNHDDDIAMWAAYVVRVRGVMRRMLRTTSV